MQDLYDKQEKEKITRALEEMKTEAGDGFSLEKVNLAELERRSGVSRQRLRRLKRTTLNYSRMGIPAKFPLKTDYAVLPLMFLNGYRHCKNTL